MAAGNMASVGGATPGLGTEDVFAALRAGWADFKAQPLFGLFFAGVYVLAGILIAQSLMARGGISWLLTAAAGFPLIAPFVAVGLYEVSRRREQGLPMSWPAILGAVRGRGDDQLILMGAFLFVLFGFWVVLARGVIAIFLADVDMAGLVADPMGFLSSGQGIAMLLVGSAFGGLMALLVFSITVFSLPMLVDRQVDVITAIVTSVGAVRANMATMLTWAALIAILLFAGMLPLFLGLLIILPVLGHATWHLYRRAIDPVRG